jgi:hypothetical protein
MAFKMNGSPAKLGTIQGTAGHRSALKKASALKISAGLVKGVKAAGDMLSQKVKESKDRVTYKKATTKDPKLAEYIKKRKTLEKGSPEWNANQNKINAAYGVKKRYPVSEPKKEEVKSVDKPKSEVKKEKIQTKADKRIAEVDENVDKKSAKQAKKDAKKKFGKDSKEYLEAKKKHLEAKEADRQGEKGGKKQTIFRRISSKINKKRQEKVDKKLAEKSAESTGSKVGKAAEAVKKAKEINSPANRNYNK